MNIVKDAKRIVFKIGSSTLTYDNGRLNLHRMEKLVRVLSDLKNGGREIVLVSSGAVSAGRAKIGMTDHKATVDEKRALAAVGQAELMGVYERFFSDYGHTVAQILMTKDTFDNAVSRENVENTFRTLLEMGCVPIVNENDSVSYDGVKFGGNDTLSAYVACVSGADVLINLSDVDGLYTADPRKDPNAAMIEAVDELTDEILALGGEAGSALGTGGMATKLRAAGLCMAAGCDMIITNGTRPEDLYRIADGESVGTRFYGRRDRA